MQNLDNMSTLTVDVPQNGPDQLKLQGKNSVPFGVFLDTFEMNMRYGPVYKPDKPFGNFSSRF